MGQRLNIEICDNNTSYANCYYHWSGYTIPALNLTKLCLKSYRENKHKESSNKSLAVHMLLDTGAGVVQQDLDKVEEHLRTEAFDRNCGLISISKAGMEQIRYWQEASVIINIENKTIDISNLFETLDLDEFLEDYGLSKEEITPEIFEKYYPDMRVYSDEFKYFSAIPFKDFLKVCSEYLKDDDVFFYYKDTLYMCIR